MKTKITFLSVAILLLTSVINTYAQDAENLYMPSGRPGYTTSASLVGDKSLLLETGFAYDNPSSTTTINTSTLRFGFNKRIEGRLNVAEHANGGDVHFSSLSVGAKIGLVDNGVAKFSILPQFNIPVDDDNASGILSLLYSTSLNDDWALSANAAVRTANRYDPFTAMAALSLSRSLNDKWSASAEVYCDGIAEYFTYNIGVALAFQVLPRLQLDLSTTRYSDGSISKLGSNWNIEAGLCWLIK